MNKVFLDTTVIIDLLAERSPFYEAIAQVTSLADRKIISILTSPISYTTSEYVLSKFEPKSSVIQKLRRFSIICKVTDANQETVDKSLFSDFPDFEDAVQYFCALQANCDVILSRNKQDFKKSELPIMTAEEYLLAFQSKSSKKS